MPLFGPSPVELDSVPFYPQTAYQCGPAALATVLAHSGLAITPASLVEELYIPKRRGSLQVELLAASRRQGRLAYLLDPDPAALLAELTAGRPVLVLQDYGWGPVSVWHYAVVIGFEPATQRFLLRSGTRRRHRESTRRFLRTWSGSERWALLVLRPGELPATARPGRYLRALLSAAEFLSAAEVRDSVAAALATWPEDPEILFAAANEALGRQALAEAQALLDRLLVRHPDHVAGRNNLAHVLAARGCTLAARREIGAALDAAVDTPFAGAVADTAAGLPLEHGAQPDYCPVSD